MAPFVRTVDRDGRLKISIGITAVCSSRRAVQVATFHMAMWDSHRLSRERSIPKPTSPSESLETGEPW